MQSFKVIDLGRMPYEAALIKQESLFNEILEHKRLGQKHDKNTLLLVEHAPVYTLGKSGDLANLKRKPEEVGATFYKTSRGGDITYHGPGQIVGYPIFDLEQFDMGIAKYIWSIEEAVIQTITEYGLIGGRIEEASGVWLDHENEKPRKICAIGVKASRYVTMHGFAFNVNTDLSFFEHIVPCGIEDKGVTSMENELGGKQNFDAIQNLVTSKFKDLFKVKTIT
ncbi:MAG: lipoyl(octanoyl) transferase LipB [Salibacteraceae bacterium]